MPWHYLTGISLSENEAIKTEYDLGIVTDAKEIIVSVSSKIGSANNWIQSGFLRIVFNDSDLGLVELFDIQLQLEKKYIPLPQGLDVRFYYRPPKYLLDFDLVIYESNDRPVLSLDQTLLLLGLI